MTTIEITKFDEIIDIAKNDNYQSIYRGQSKEYNTLIPGINREDIKKSKISQNPLDKEPSITRTFIRYSSTLEYKLKLPNDNEEWLFLAQHNGVPTRLLDWTENILKALFFSIIDHPDSNGELWSLEHKELNELSNNPHFIDIKNTSYKYLIEDAFRLSHEKDELKKEINIQVAIDKPLAILPSTLKNRRLENQEGAFTIHPYDAQDLANLDYKNCLKRFIIPAKKKKEFEKILEKFGISYSKLFPDFYGITQHLKRIIKEG